MDTRDQYFILFESLVDNLRITNNFINTTNEFIKFFRQNQKIRYISQRFCVKK